MPKQTNNWEERLEMEFTYMFNFIEVQTGISERERLKSFISQEITKAENRVREEIKQLVIEDVPHQYQGRLLNKLKEE